MANPYGPAGNANLPGHLCLWDKMKAKWATPKVIDSDGTYTLQPLELTDEGYQIVLSEFGSNKEHLLFENRQKLEFDLDLYGTGLAIYHIDDSAEGQKLRGYPGQVDDKGIAWPDNGNHYEVAMLQADGLYELEQALDSGDADDLWQPGQKLGPGNSKQVFPNTDMYMGGWVSESGITITVLESEGLNVRFKVCGTGKGTCDGNDSEVGTAPPSNATSIATSEVPSISLSAAPSSSRSDAPSLTLKSLAPSTKPSGAPSLSPSTRLSDASLAPSRRPSASSLATTANAPSQSDSSGPSLRPAGPQSSIPPNLPTLGGSSNPRPTTMPAIGPGHGYVTRTPNQAPAPTNAPISVLSTNPKETSTTNLPNEGEGDGSGSGRAPTNAPVPVLSTGSKETPTTNLLNGGESDGSVATDGDATPAVPTSIAHTIPIGGTSSMRPPAYEAVDMTVPGEKAWLHPNSAAPGKRALPWYIMIASTSLFLWMSI
jgi:hypothetical protein